MTGLEEAEMRQRLIGAPEQVAKLPNPPEFKIDSLPARVLLQRPDVETARRNVLSAELEVKALEQEQVGAWIALYRAAGGSWSDSANSPSADAATSGNSNQNNTFIGGKS